MSILTKLFGRAKSTSTQPSTLTKQFDQEWFATVQRFAIVAGFKNFQFNLKHPQTGEVMQPHVGVAGTFDDWKQIESPWDRRRLLFELLFTSVERSMQIWQIANILVAIRQPDQAVSLMQQTSIPEPDSEDYAPFCEAFARALQYFQKPQDAVEWARKAYKADANMLRTQLRLADVLFMTGECDEANAIYSSRMQTTKSTNELKDGDIASMFSALFAQETGAVHSPVFAIEIGEKLDDPQQAMAFWKLAENEFYDSAYFRMQHAYYLLKHGENARAITKLIALVQEMPWLREASLNLEMLFKQFDPTGKLMPEFQQQLRQIIHENEWTTEGMNQLKIDVDNKDSNN